MSFWNGVKRAFGFAQESEGEEDEYSSALPTYAVTAPPVPITPPGHLIPAAPVDSSDPDVESAASCPDDETDPSQQTQTDEDDRLPADLFDAVIKVFNDAQPKFVRDCLSLDYQRAYLIDSISEKLRRRVSGSGSEDHASLLKRIETLESEAKRNEDLKEDNNKLRLSLTRQKRAMLDRIKDLEAQVAHLTETKTHGAETRPNPADDPASNAKKDERIAELEGELTELRGRLESAPKSTGQADRVEELEKELERRSALMEQLEMKSRMSDEMMTELRNAAAKARQDLELVTAEREEATQLLADQLDGFERLKERLENRIKDLTEQLEAEQREDRAGTIARLNEENASLRHTIENNLYNQANSEMRLRKEIKTLNDRISELEQMQAGGITSTAETLPSTDSASPAPRRRGRPKKTRIDAELDNSEWFAPGSAKKDDPDFGYHEPPRRPSNDNAAQLSLF